MVLLYHYIRHSFLFIAVQKVTFFVQFLGSKHSVVINAMDVSSSNILLSFGRTCGGAVCSSVNSLVVLAACSLIVSLHLLMDVS